MRLCWQQAIIQIDFQISSMSSQKIEVQKLQQSNYEQLVNTMKAAYSNWGGSVWSERAIKKLLSVFPEGQLIVMVDRLEEAFFIQPN